MRYWLMAALAPMLWGSTYLITGLWLTGLSPLWVAVYRALPIGIVLVLLFPARYSRRDWGRVALLGLLNIGLFFPLLFVAAFRLPGSIAGTLGATLPLQILLLLWLWKGQVPRSNQLLAALAGILGIGLLLGLQGKLDGIGVAAALVASLLVAICTLLISYWQLPGNPLAFTGWQLVIGGALLLPVALWWEGAPVLPQGDAWLGLLWMALMNTGLAYLAWICALQQVSADRLGFLTLLNPLVAVLAGITLLGEHLSPQQWLGVTLVLGALVLARSRPARRSATTV